ncbi:MAG: rhomboid family intramembrane serine protease [Deltaproteobacteria bacterium]|nr:rhomboid family intramembrane serine protease [Deltaproteobacteria bacterium]
MTAEPYQRGPIVLPPFGKGARILLGVVWVGYLAWLVSALWIRAPWAMKLTLDPLLTTIGLEPWRLVTHVFVNEPLSLVLESIFVWFLAGDLEARWGTRAFLRFCVWVLLLSAIGALVAVPILLVSPPGSTLAALCGPTAGPLGIVFGLSAAWSTVYPDRTIYLLFFIPVRGRWIVRIGLIITALMVLAMQTTLTSLLASIAGSIAGWLLVTGKWRPSRWRTPKAKTRGRPPPGGSPRGLRVIRGGRDDDDDDDDDDGDSLPPKPKYLN